MDQHWYFKPGQTYVDTGGDFTVLLVSGDAMLIQYGNLETEIRTELDHEARVVECIGGDFERYADWRASLTAAECREVKWGTYSVYVVKLDESAKRSKRVVYRGRPEMPAVYVGLTGQTVEERFNDHVTGHKTRIRRFAIELMPELYEQYNPLSTWEEAKKVENALAKYLFIFGGYTVLGGH